jgi:hypothetical protein
VKHQIFSTKYAMKKCIFSEIVFSTNEENDCQTITRQFFFKSIMFDDNVTLVAG